MIADTSITKNSAITRTGDKMAYVTVEVEVDVDDYVEDIDDYILASEVARRVQDRDGQKFRDELKWRHMEEMGLSKDELNFLIDFLDKHGNMSYTTEALREKLQDLRG